MPGKALAAEERLSLLQVLAAVPVDADDDDAVLRTFLPGPQHRQALQQRVLVVRGERGAGKTALFQLLRAAQRRSVPLSGIVEGAPEGRRIDGYCEQGTVHAPAHVLAQFAAQAGPDDIRAFWLGHLCGRLQAEGAATGALPPAFARAYEGDPGHPARWVAEARACLADLYARLDAVERGAGETWFVVYDHLDRVGTTDRAVRERVSSGLLDVWFSLSQRYERLRGKVLLREDLFQAALASFADATKLEARSVLLDWNGARLYALLARRMGADDGLRSWLQDVAHLPLTRAALGWMPPAELDEETQWRFTRALVGPYMGVGPTKGLSHRWLLNHLQDAHLRVTPRALVQLVRGAAEVALARGPGAAFRRLLTPAELQLSLEKASLRRVAELKEDFPVVGRLEGLRGENLFLPRREVVRALSRVRVADGFEGDPNAAFEELQRIGVVADRGGGRIDVPDVYRYGFGILRKGGVRRVI